MRLGKKFLRSIMYAKQNAVGIRLIASKIVITMLSVKLYIGNMRQKSRVANLITINEEYNHILSGISYHPISIQYNHYY